jgi:hypothetical protein
VAVGRKVSRVVEESGVGQPPVTFVASLTSNGRDLACDAGFERGTRRSAFFPPNSGSQSEM